MSDIDLTHINIESQKQRVFLSLCGPFSQNLLAEMGDGMKTKMKLEGADNNTIRKAFSILVEINQNIIHYSAERLEITNTSGQCVESGCGIITVGFQDDHYFIMCGNIIKNRKVTSLKEKLHKLSLMSTQELKEYYKQQRRQPPDVDSKGAGIGLIEIARKSSQPLEFDFKEINEQFSFFTLKTVI